MKDKGWDRMCRTEDTAGLGVTPDSRAERATFARCLTLIALTAVCKRWLHWTLSSAVTSLCCLYCCCCCCCCCCCSYRGYQASLAIIAKHRRLFGVWCAAYCRKVWKFRVYSTINPAKLQCQQRGLTVKTAGDSARPPR